MRTYRIRKKKAREKAIEYQIQASEKCMSYQEIIDNAEKFKKLGKRYGLLTEFRENGIC